jgi:hypothetical protein
VNVHTTVYQHCVIIVLLIVPAVVAAALAPAPLYLVDENTNSVICPSYIGYYSIIVMLPEVMLVSFHLYIMWCMQFKSCTLIDTIRMKMVGLNGVVFIGIVSTCCAPYLIVIIIIIMCARLYLYTYILSGHEVYNDPL